MIRYEADAAPVNKNRVARVNKNARRGRPKVHADRAAYRREWMRRWRAAKAAGKGASARD